MLGWLPRLKPIVGSGAHVGAATPSRSPWSYGASKAVRTRVPFPLKKGAAVAGDHMNRHARRRVAVLHMDGRPMARLRRRCPLPLGRGGRFEERWSPLARGRCARLLQQQKAGVALHVNCLLAIARRVDLLLLGLRRCTMHAMHAMHAVHACGAGSARTVCARCARCCAHVTCAGRAVGC